VGGIATSSSVIAPAEVTAGGLLLWLLEEQARRPCDAEALAHALCVSMQSLNPLRQAWSENIIAFTVRAEGYNKSKCHSSIKIYTQSHLDIEGMKLRMTLRMRF